MMGNVHAMGRGEEGFQHRVSRGATEGTEMRNPRTQAGMAVPQEKEKPKNTG
jgi:hypothetical protein